MANYSFAGWATQAQTVTEAETETDTRIETNTETEAKFAVCLVKRP